MDRILIIFLSLSTLSASAQVALVNRSFDYGKLTRADQNYADFGIQNQTDQDVIIFRVDVPKHVDVSFSDKTISPNQTEYIRIAYNPTAVGPFIETFDVHLSAWSSPSQITVSGESTFAANSFIPCPDFSKDPAAALRPFNITVRSLENVPIESEKLSVYQYGVKQGDFYTDENGETRLYLTAGKYFFALDGLDTSIYVNAVNDHLVAFLDKEAVVSQEISDTEESDDRGVEEGDQEAELPREETEEEKQLENVLSGAEYMPNNLVFLVDVSTSMKHNGKLDLLKVSMIELVDVLRSYDRFTLISYATEAGVILKTSKDLDREACRQAIVQLNAGGKTEGAKAVNRAGRAAEDFFIDDGNNQIILATDGAFNEGAQKAKKFAAKYRRKGITTSVVGIKCGKYTAREMQELAQAGGGAFIPIENVKDAEDRILDEVKQRSKRVP
jgi:Ca-activated chloride channel family protein